jgi:Transposase, Mutator family
LRQRRRSRLRLHRSPQPCPSATSLVPFSPPAHVRIVRAVEHADTTTSGKWAPTNRPVRPSAGVNTEMDEESQRRERCWPSGRSGRHVLPARGDPHRLSPRSIRGRWGGRRDLEPRIPKLRAGSFFPSLLERRRRVDQALFVVMMEAQRHRLGQAQRTRRRDRQLHSSAPWCLPRSR